GPPRPRQPAGTELREIRLCRRGRLGVALGSGSVRAAWLGRLQSLTRRYRRHQSCAAFARALLPAPRCPGLGRGLPALRPRAYDVHGLDWVALVSEDEGQLVVRSSVRLGI